MKLGTSALVFFVSFASASLAFAQEVANLPSGTTQSIGVEGGLESAFMARVNYAHELPGFLRDAMVYARFTWPFAEPDLADFAFDAGLRATAVGGDHWKLQFLLGPVIRNTSNAEFSATALGVRTGLLAGYRSDGWGLMADLGYEQILSTHLRHSDLYRSLVYSDAKDGWYALTAGTFQAGLRGGARIGRVELYGTLGGMTTERLTPMTPPFYATVGSSYAF